MKKFLITAAVALTSVPAAAADLTVPDVLPVVAPVAQPFSWSGFYIGLHGGAALRDGNRSLDCDSFSNFRLDDDEFSEVRDCFDATQDDEDSPRDGERFPAVNFFDGDDQTISIVTDDGDDDDIGFLGGAQVGVNAQYGRVVLGLEGDISGVIEDKRTIGLFDSFDGIDNTCDTAGDVDPCLETYDGTGRIEEELHWVASLRARLGLAVGSEGRGLIYLTGGGALAGVEWDASFDPDEAVGDTCAPDDNLPSEPCFFSDDEDDEIAVGVVVGVGGEYAITDRVSIGGEYLGYFFEEEGRTLTFNGDNERFVDVDVRSGVDDVHTFRAKVNWHFGPPT
jgi:opacity protein-like surface antigen